MRKCRYFIAIYVFNILFINLFSIEIDVLKSPQPTCTEKDFKSLEMVKSISNIDEKVFLAQPVALTGDDDGNIYIYDNLHCKIFKFNKDHHFIKSFGQIGREAGAFGASGGMATIYFGKNGILYVCDYMQKKIISFTSEGKHLKDFKIIPWRIFLPVVDAKGNFYLPSAGNGMIDVEDSNMNHKTTLLSENEYHRCLFIEPNYYFSRTEIFANYFNTDVRLLPPSDILIYNRNTSTVYLLDKNYKLVRKVNLWPENALKNYRDRLLVLQKEEDYENAWISFFHTLFIDEDEKNFFYLQTSSDQFNVLIYAFDLKGQLVKVLKIEDETFVSFKWKKNNLFYGFGVKNDLKIYKEKIK